ncbi:hypothetical protein [Streptomyces sp. NPDC127190]|uniref:hypothetical protein n=1 Tax=unclassified Streptomyces TaxID=2593676 RepID=UPI003638B8D4
MDRVLLVRLWLSAFGSFLPLLVGLVLKGAVQDGFGWALAEEVTLVSLVWAVLGLLCALYVCGALARGARGTGIPVTAAALDTVQQHTFPAERAERLRAALAKDGRAVEVRGAERVEFGWRPFRGRRSVTGSLAFDPESGKALLRVRAADAVMRGPGRSRASAFVALCQLARLVPDQGEEAPAAGSAPVPLQGFATSPAEPAAGS